MRTAAGSQLRAIQALTWSRRLAGPDTHRWVCALVRKGIVAKVVAAKHGRVPAGSASGVGMIGDREKATGGNNGDAAKAGFRWINAQATVKQAAGLLVAVPSDIK